MSPHSRSDVPAGASIVRDVLIPARRAAAFEVAPGETVRFIDVQGQQCADLIAFNLLDLSERLSPFDSVARSGRLYAGAGDVLVSDRGHDMLRVVNDRVEHHDLLCGSCSPGLNRTRHAGEGAGKRTCHVNFVELFAPRGVAPEDIPYSFNVFMNYPVDSSGAMEYATCKSRAGDYIDLLAETALLVGISNCPQELTPLNGFNPTESRVIVYRNQQDVDE